MYQHNLHVWMDVHNRLVRIKSNASQSEFELNSNILTKSLDLNTVATYGQSLFNAVLDIPIFTEALDAANTGNQPLRLLIQATNHGLDAHHWELLHDGEKFLSEKNVVVVRTNVDILSAKPIFISQNKIHILLVLAPAAEGMTDQQCTDEEHMIRDLARYSTNVIEVDILRDPSIMALRQRVMNAHDNDEPYHILHYCGHQPIDSTLYFKDNPYEFPQLQSLLNEYGALRLVTLNLAGELFTPERFAHTAIPYLLSPTLPINAEARYLFFSQFYHMVFQQGIASALNKARQQVQRTVFKVEDWAGFAAFTSTLSDELVKVQQPEFSIPSGAIMRDQIFVSYSHRDQDWCDQLMGYLDPLRKNHVIKAWIDKDITAGTDWLEEIRTALQKMKVAVILASPEFFRSSFIKEEELPYILECRKEGQCTVIWVAVKAYTYEFTPLNDIQAIHTPTQPLDRLSETEAQDVMLKIARAVAKALQQE